MIKERQFQPVFLMKHYDQALDSVIDAVTRDTHQRNNYLPNKVFEFNHQGLQWESVSNICSKMTLFNQNVSKIAIDELRNVFWEINTL